MVVLFSKELQLARMRAIEEAMGIPYYLQNQMIDRMFGSMDKEPKPLFNDAPIKKEGPKPLFSSEVHSIGTNDSVRYAVQAKPPASLFGISPEEQKARDYAQATYPELFAVKGTLINSRIMKFFPLDINSVMQWGEKVMTEQQRLIGEAAKIIKHFSDGDVNETMQAILKDVKPPKTFAAKLMDRISSPLSRKPDVVVMKASMTGLKDKCEPLEKELVAWEEKLQLYAAAITSVDSTYKGDQSIEKALRSRRELFNNMLLQTKMSLLKTQEIYKIILDTMQECDRLLTVTFPALEMNR